MNDLEPHENVIWQFLDFAAANFEVTNLKIKLVKKSAALGNCLVQVVNFEFT